MLKRHRILIRLPVNYTDINHIARGAFIMLDMTVCGHMRSDNSESVTAVYNCLL